MSLGSNIISVAYITCMGLMLGTLITASNLYGEKKYSEIGAVWRRSIPYSILLGSIILIITFAAEPILLLCGQPPELAKEAAIVIRIYGYGMPIGGLVYVTSQYFLEGIKRPLPGMCFMLGANCLNIGLNWILVYGHLGFEPMGASGSAWGTTVIRILLALGIVTYLWCMKDATKFGIRKKWQGTFSHWAEQRRLGYAAGLSFGIEHVSFVVLFMLAAILGTIQLAAMTIVFNTFAIFFMIAAGIGGATAVQVGIAWGENNPDKIALFGWLGFALQAIVMLIPATLMMTCPLLFVQIYTTDNELASLAAPLYILGGAALILDTSQTLWSNALRGRHDKWFPTVSHFLSYIGIMIPLAYYLSFTLNRGPKGLFESLLLASMVSVLSLTARFVWLQYRDKKEKDEKNLTGKIL